MTDTDAWPELALIGPTGGMGQKILEELVHRNIATRAIVRRTDAAADGDRVRRVVVDVDDTDALTSALRGVTTLISAFNPGWHAIDLYRRYLDGARSIKTAAVEAGVGRMIVIGGASSLIGDDGRELIEHGLPPEPYGSGVRAARDLLLELRSAQQPDWVFLSPPMECGPMGPQGRTGLYRIGHDHPVVDEAGRNSLSVEDLAVAVVDEALQPRFHRERFTVGY